jgi:ComF family protein
MRSLLDLLLPPACAGCSRRDALLCERCRSQLRPPSGPRDRFAAPDAGVVIGAEFAVAIAAYAYDGPMRRALAALKYQGTSRLAAVLAGSALPALKILNDLSGPAALVPVPVHEERRRIRGYNQAELIARGLSAAGGGPIADILVRTRPTTRQHRLDRASRLANLRGAIGIRERMSVPRTVILVDDIITTTATMEACAAAVRIAGAMEAYGFSIAREV